MRSPNEQSAEELLAADHQALDVLVHKLITDLHLANVSTTVARLDLFWARLAMHIRAENLHLFPGILNAGNAGLGVPDSTEPRETLDKLRRDHDFFMHELANAVNVMRDFIQTSNGNAADPPEVVRAIVIGVIERLEAHNRLEEEIVYGLPARLLPATKQAELAAQVRRELENLPPRFSGV